MQFLLLEKEWSLQQIVFLAVSKRELNIRFTGLRCEGEHWRQSKDLFQRWLFNIIELRLVSPFKHCVLKVVFFWCVYAGSFLLGSLLILNVKVWFFFF